MAKRMNRSYALEDGLQEQLQAALKTALTAHTEEWSKQVDGGTIGEEARSVFAAMGWLSSRSDSRLTVEPQDVEPEKGE